MKTNFLWALLAISLLILGAASPSFGVGSGAGAINMIVNTSSRFEAMGGAGVGMPWGTDTNHWANPALLAYRPGLNYLHYRSTLAVGLADGIEMQNDELTFGRSGLTVLLARGPVSGNFLEMGMSPLIDEDNVYRGEYHTYMKTLSFGIGVDAVQMLDRYLKHEDSPWSRYLSVAVGVTRHSYSDRLAADQILMSGPIGPGSGSATDFGYVIRGNSPTLEAGPVGIFAGVAMGRSLKAYTNDFITHDGVNNEDPFPRTHIKGWSIHVAVPITPSTIEKANSGIIRHVLTSISPLFSYTRTSQLSEPGYLWNGTAHEYGHDTSGKYEKKGDGWEVGMLNTFYIRRGHDEELWGSIDGDTDGHGINLQAGLMGGVRYDIANRPQAIGLPRVESKTWSFWVCPREIFGW